MKARLNNYCSRWRRTGLSLIELVAALAVLGTILAGVVVAKARHTRQLAEAKHRLEAVALADRTIAQWWMSPEGLPIDQHGTVGRTPALRWRSQLVPNDELQRLGARVVRVEFSDAAAEAGQADPVLVVELALPRDDSELPDQPERLP